MKLYKEDDIINHIINLQDIYIEYIDKTYNTIIKLKDFIEIEFITKENTYNYYGKFNKYKIIYNIYRIKDLSIKELSILVLHELLHVNQNINWYKYINDNKYHLSIEESVDKEAKKILREKIESNYHIYNSLKDYYNSYINYIMINHKADYIENLLNNYHNISIKYNDIEYIIKIHNQFIIDQIQWKEVLKYIDSNNIKERNIKFNINKIILNI